WDGRKDPRHVATCKPTDRCACARRASTLVCVDGSLTTAPHSGPCIRKGSRCMRHHCENVQWGNTPDSSDRYSLAAIHEIGAPSSQSRCDPRSWWLCGFRDRQEYSRGYARVSC